MAAIIIAYNNSYYTSNNDTFLGKTKNLFRFLWKGEVTAPPQTLHMRNNISLADEAIQHARQQIILVPNFISDLFYPKDARKPSPSGPR